MTIYTTRNLDEAAMFAADARLDRKEDNRVARLAAEGYTYCLCSRCDETRPLAWVDGTCNAYDPDTESERCGGRFNAYRPAEAIAYGQGLLRG